MSTLIDAWRAEQEIVLRRFDERMTKNQMLRRLSYASP